MFFWYTMARSQQRNKMKENSMLHINGKYNHARIMIDEIDDTTREQIQSMVCTPPVFRSLRWMRHQWLTSPHET